jgi:hypothetical protein
VRYEHSHERSHTEGKEEIPLRKREFRVPVYLTFDEKEDLHRKAQAACMDHNQFIRMLIMGYAPRPAPDDRFYQAMDLIREMGDRLERMETKVRDPDVIRLLEAEAEKWHMLQSAFERICLSPERMEL